VNVLDLVLLLLLVVAAAVGYQRGATLQLFSYGGLLIGLFVGATLAPRIGTLIHGRAEQAGIAVGMLLLFGAVGDAIGWLIGHRVRSHARGTRVLGQADAAGGSLIALVATLLAIWFIALNLVNGPFPRLAAEVRGSAIVRGLGSTLPDPPSILGEVRRLFDRFGFPEVFDGIPPAPADPVRQPSREEAQRVVGFASASTVKVIGHACDSIQEGSGFVVADGYVVTNAHVVAGMDQPVVVTSSGSDLGAVVVSFDPVLDLAVLQVGQTIGPPLSLTPTEVGRGTTGAVLGYPGGGSLTGTPAAVRQPIAAVGHDIYGHGDVERDVYELQATVRPGNSGGPFVLADGTVAGVVFASSSVDPTVGYALTSTEVQGEVGQAIGRTSAVDTGPCVP
jgi:S1-C subfamily serine protease